MAEFKYTARSRKGEKTEGTVEAPDRHSALIQLEKMGCVPVSVMEKSASAVAVSGKEGPRFTWLTGLREKMVVRSFYLLLS